MGRQTPIAEKIRKSTPKSVPKRSKDALHTLDVAIELKRATFRRTELGSNDSSSIGIDIPSICTPTRTTRSMARFDAVAMPPPASTTIPSFVTPSKRNTSGVSKTSAKKSVAQENSTTGKLVLSKNKANDTAIGAPDTLERSSKVANTPQNGQFVRSRKSIGGNSDVELTDEENLPSVSMLGAIPRSGMKKAGKFARSLKSIDTNSGPEPTDDEDLPSVSMLGSEETPGRFVRSMEWKQSPSNDEENALNNSTASAGQFVRSRKSIPANENGSIGNKDQNVEQNELGEELTAAKSANKTETPIKTAEAESRSTRRSKQAANDQTESSDDGLASVSILGILKSARKSTRTREIKSIIELPTVKPTVTFTSPVFIENSKSDFDASYGTNESQEAIAENQVNDALQSDDKMSMNVKSRVSIIDLTESPSNNQKLNTTFSPKPAADGGTGDGMNRTFTEETELNKTFSPVPSASNGAYLTPLVILNTSTKPMSKKNSPQLKRLNVTPMRKATKGTKNLSTPGKMSSAKKTKILEAARELCDTSAKKPMKPTKINCSTPKLFKFGDDENNKPMEFRFSMVQKPEAQNQLQKSEYSCIAYVCIQW